MSERNPTPDELDAILQLQNGDYGVEVPDWWPVLPEAKEAIDQALYKRAYGVDMVAGMSEAIMSGLRAPREPGRHMLGMSHACGFDGGYNDRPGCGQPATLHLFAGEPPATIGEYAMLACEEHAEAAKKLAIDWHTLAPVCGVPDSIWHFKSEQAKGFCFWPEAEAAIHEAVRNPSHTRGADE